MSDSVVNDFTLRIATPNGTGSHTSNSIIYRTLFHMGLAPSAKNLFPSNIQGLPTWYQIRVSPHGYQARTEQWQVLLALNPATVRRDLEEIPAGEVVIYNADAPPAQGELEGLTAYGVPFDTLARRNIKDAKLRPKLRNLIYVGVVQELFGLDAASVEAAVRSMFPSKENVVGVNLEACQLGVDFARENLEKTDPYRYQGGQNQTEGKIFIEGNEAAALGAVFGGCSVVAWYPITPASSLAEFLIPHLNRFRTDEDGKRRFAVVQAEDELAAIGMALGAGWAGARSMTSTSGPGISLMAENLGYGYYAEIPTVVYDIQRSGPSTGLPTRTQQSDLLLVAHNSHGDTRFPMLIPADPSEIFEMSWQAFDLADHYQIPVMFMSDLDLGMNVWVSDELAYPDRPLDRGKIITDEMLEKLGSWGRYEDVDGDGVPYRSVPGWNARPEAAYFTRGSGHDRKAHYSEDSEIYIDNLDRLARKVAGMAEALPAPIVQGSAEAPLGLIAFGSSDYAVQEALAQRDGDIAYLRLRAFPFSRQVEEFIEKREQVLVVEQNQQGQMTMLLQSEFPRLAPRIKSACYYGGLPLSAEFVSTALTENFASVRGAP